MNPEFPTEPLLRDEAQRTIDDWDVAMRETVAGLRMTTQSSGRRIWQLSRRSAQDAAAHHRAQGEQLQHGERQKFVSRQPRRAQAGRGARRRRTCWTSTRSEPTNLLKACTALEVVTEARPHDDPKKFIWQRNGDLRYSFLHWVDRPQVQGPLGYGPSSPDPETGEIISATAFIYGAALDTYAQVRRRQRAGRQRAARHRRPAVGQDDQRRAGRDGARQPDAQGSEDDRRRARHGQGQDAGARTDARQAPGQGGRRHRRPAAGQRSRAPASRSCCSTTTCCPPSPRLPPRRHPAGQRAGAGDDQAVAVDAGGRSAGARASRRFANHGCVYMAEFADDAILGLALELDRDEGAAGRAVQQDCAR